MKRIQSILLAIAMLLAAPAFFTSCQEDAPEINYTMNVSVINDFTKVMEAINNGFLKNEEAIRKLTEAIDKMNADQQTKLQAIIDVLNSVNATLETRFAAIEAVIKAQTLSLEAKLGLIEAAIKALPDYGDKLAAIEAAIKAMPNYSDKFDAVVAALNAMKAQIESLGTGQADIVTAINNTTAAINSLIAAVNSGNADTAAALAQIIQKLEELKEKIGNGGGGVIPPTPQPTMEYVDLGLSVKWATCNLGATKPSDYGHYYAWSETMVKGDYSWDTYKWGKGNNITKYNDSDGKTVLDPEDDVATAKLGSPWRMPTKDEINELIGGCTWKWTKKNGVRGHEVKGTNGKTIFLPAAGTRKGFELLYTGESGFYWSASRASNEINKAFYFDNGYSNIIDDNLIHARITDRYRGYMVRPVRP
ncbi:hypothetical protein BFO_2197 [Tannerella forsythia 92A2]|uniref:DUF1566 domain-containing protein n=1 Tax=Tannerella forsythia (strain ATCC 43037 / JCM 10827 / CCUG 21028 A / KCTC 5666 / FDC 338) TaxID=203275 RepID=G8UIP2_TANFA|nr:methyl-accepting chemotaxis protein [Tannerella forsythia]AEW20588.1 hypothetical protein BFO_2197 [Tannerella forsythia 92A2]